MSELSYDVPGQLLCPERSTKAEIIPLSKGFRAVQLWPCSRGTGYSENLLYGSSTLPTCLAILPVHWLSNSTCKKNSDKAKTYQLARVSAWGINDEKHLVLNVTVVSEACSSIVSVNPGADRFRSLLQNSAGCWNFWWFRQSPDICWPKGKVLSGGISWKDGCLWIPWDSHLVLDYVGERPFHINFSLPSLWHFNSAFDIYFIEETRMISLDNINKKKNHWELNS